MQIDSGSKKRSYSEFVKPSLLSHRFSSKSDLLCYLTEHRKCLYPLYNMIK